MLEIGLEFDRSELESPGFLRRGGMSERLNFDGKLDFVNDRFNI